MYTGHKSTRSLQARAPVHKLIVVLHLAAGAVRLEQRLRHDRTAAVAFNLLLRPRRQAFTRPVVHRPEVNHGSEPCGRE